MGDKTREAERTEVKMEKMSRMAPVAALVPAYNPSGRLPALIRELSMSDFRAIIVVDDGSAKECEPIFRELERMEKVTLLRHGVNLGKGAALKTGLNHVYCYLRDLAGVVTVDADGQHLCSDALKVADRLKENPEALIIGTRSFGRDVPLRSRLGNVLTRHLFKYLVGQRLSDTQSGLRGIPTSLIPVLLRIDSNGYEFELDMLLACKYGTRRIIEQPVSTVYIEANKSSHFHPLIDSMRVYFVLLRFTFTSLLSAVIDNIVFILIYSLSSSIISSQIGARAISMLFNYSAVRKAVFYSDMEHSSAFPRYLLLVIISGSVSYLMIIAAVSLFSVPVIAAKLCAESIVFFANFAIQRDLIFVRNSSVAGIANNRL